MANNRDDNRRLIALVTERGWRKARAQEWNLLRDLFPRMAETTLRNSLAAMGLKIDQPFRGVDLQSLSGLEDTLTELAAFYLQDPRTARKMVIAAKDKSRFAARNKNAAPQKRALKLEMVEWMLVWLGDPAMFATWARLRKNQLSHPD